MILGVAQLVFNAGSLDNAKRVLAGDYEESFREQQLPVHRAKRHLLTSERSSLAMAHCAAPGGGMAVELTAYAGSEPAGDPAYFADLAREVASVSTPWDGRHHAVAFWERLGFRPREEDDGGLDLEMPALPPSHRLRLRLDRGLSALGRATLGAEGCVMVTILATSAAAALAELSQVPDVDCEGPWRECVGGREVEVAIAAAPGGAIVELLELPRKRAPS